MYHGNDKRNILQMVDNDEIKNAERVFVMTSQERQVMVGHIESMLEAMENDVKNTKERDFEIPDYDIERLIENRNIFEEMKEVGTTVNELNWLFIDVKLLYNDWRFNV